MQIEIHGQNLPVTPELSESVRASLHGQLDGLRSAVGRVLVRVRQAPAADARNESSCHLLVQLVPSGGLSIQEAAAEPRLAVARAAERARAAAERELLRRERWRRSVSRRAAYDTIE